MVGGALLLFAALTMPRSPLISTPAFPVYLYSLVGSHPRLAPMSPPPLTPDLLIPPVQMLAALAAASRGPSTTSSTLTSWAAWQTRSRRMHCDTCRHARRLPAFLACLLLSTRCGVLATQPSPPVADMAAGDCALPASAGQLPLGHLALRQQGWATECVGSMSMSDVTVICNCDVT